MFYVYEFRDNNGVPFYVGKGSRKRMFAHEAMARRGIKSHFYNKLRKLWAAGLQHQKAIVFETLFEELAFDEERRLIDYYGRENLTNQTDGGDGTSNPSAEARAKIAAGRRGIIASEATRNRQRLAKLGTHRSEETKRKIAAYWMGKPKPWARQTALKNLASGKMDWTGKKRSPESIAKFKAARMGHAVTQETRDKISSSKKGSVPWNKKH